MIRRLRSPSLFVTFAGAFLGVLVIAALLQGVALVTMGRSVMDRLARGRAEIQAREIALRLAEALEAEGDLASILDAYTPAGPGRGPVARGPEPLFFYRDATGKVTTPSRFPRRLAVWLGAFLEGEVGAEPPFGRRGREPRRPPPPDAPPGAEPPPGPDPRQRPRPEILARTPVTGPAGPAGEVVAVRFGLPPRFPGSAFGDRSMRLLFFVPLAVLVSALAGLLMFRHILRRIRELEKLAVRVADGNLNARVDDPGRDEIGRLGSALNVMTERLALAKATLEENDRQRRQLFADISHELATPLTSIRGYTETLLDKSVDISPGERRAYLQNVVDASQRVALLIEDLMELTRLEAGAVQMAKERLDWTALCRNTMNRFRSQFDDARVEIEWLGSEEPAWVMADGRRMEQVVDNLLVNALRYVPAGSSVTMGLEAVPHDSGLRYRLTVSDDGPGFPAEELEHVFDRFFRGRRAGATDGSGLGLAIVKEIVVSHGGEVRAHNREPTGAVIEVDLPAGSER
ncbi:MAG: HAMP domain-containing histidine kinase [Candidatus Latescibacterota bacterium]|nr:MAG: HAMP domain-containing histidine kinase [Candidatus Latescibacterota bacterium]